MILTIHFDGSAVPKNPGGIAISAFHIIDEDGVVIHQQAAEICRGPKATNNVAEWAALTAGIAWVKKHHPAAKVRIKGDSQLVINQLNEVYACRKDHLLPFLHACQKFLLGTDWDAIWVPRGENEDADQLARNKYKEIISTPVRVRVLFDDMSGRFKKGDEGTTLENDFWIKYQYKVNLDNKGVFYFCYEEVEVMTIFTELLQVDKFLGLPEGTTRSVFNHNESSVVLLNEKLASHNIKFEDDGTLSKDQRPAWKALMQRLGLSKEWWLDGSSSSEADDLPPVRVLGE